MSRPSEYDGDPPMGNLGDYELGEVVAIQGKADCTDVRCSRYNGKCVGYHCPKCGESCSMIGHRVCPEKEATDGGN